MARRHGAHAGTSGKLGCLWKAIAAVFVLSLIGSCMGGGARTGDVGKAPAITAATTAAPATSEVAATTETPAAETAAATTAAEPAPVAVSGRLTASFVDVGQGDATVVTFPDGKVLVVDAGRDGGTAVNATLGSGRHIDWLVATHPDADHIGGIPDVLAANDVASVWAPNVNHSTKTYTNFLEAVASKGLGIDVVERGKTIGSGEGYSIEALWPPAGASYDDTNDYSAILLVRFGSQTMLLTGDAPVEAERQATDGHVDVLKVSHHGSSSGTDAALAQRLTPGVAVLSYATDNSYGHPTQAVLDSLATVPDCQVYGTGANGTIVVTLDGSAGVEVSCARRGTVVVASQDAGSGSGSLSSGTDPPAAQAAAPAAPAADAGADTVYVTRTGEKFHRQGCRTTKRSKSLTPMSRSEAVDAGYDACKVCNP